MAVPTTTPLPTSPNRQAGAGEFPALADRFYAAMPQFQVDMNAVAAFADARAVAAEAAKAAAESARNAASGSATMATTQAARSETAAQQSQAAAAAAGAAAGLPAIEGRAGQALTVRLDGTGVAYNNEFSRYTLSARSTTALLDLAGRQVFRVNASAPLTLAFVDPPGADRAMVVVVQVAGSSAVTWPPGIAWAGGMQPVLAPNWTRVLLFWDGVAWSGSVGASA